MIFCAFAQGYANFEQVWENLEQVKIVDLRSWVCAKNTFPFLMSNRNFNKLV